MKGYQAIVQVGRSHALRRDENGIRSMAISRAGSFWSRAWPVGRCGCGRWPAVNAFVRSRVMRVGAGRWRSAAMGSDWSGFL